MRRVLIESPYKGLARRNECYARMCCAHAFTLGDAPFASHLLYTQDGILDDTVDAERALGISAGLVWGAIADATCLYIDLGISGGMRLGVTNAKQYGRSIEIRSLHSALTIVCGNGPIDETLAKAPAVFGDGNAAAYYAAQSTIAERMMQAATEAFPLRLRSKAMRRRIQQAIS